MKRDFFGSLSWSTCIGNPILEHPVSLEITIIMSTKLSLWKKSLKLLAVGVA